MLTYLRVNGFKSLVDFEVNFFEGLNVIIGPNGSGKTTICQALGILSSLAEGNIEEYLLSIGGSASIFTKRVAIDEENVSLDAACGDNSNCPLEQIEVVCSGSAAAKGKKNENVLIKYQYEVKMSIDNGLTIDHEKLMISVYNDKTKRYKTALESVSSKNEIILRIKDVNLLVMKKLPGKNKKTYRFARMSSSDSLLKLNGYVTFVGFCFLKDISSIQLYNIDPSIAKKTSDVMDPKYMDEKGGYLANNINFFASESKEAFQELNDFVKSLCPRYEEIYSTTGHSHGRKRTFSLKDKDGVEVYAYDLSDGTVKAIALYVAMLNSEFGSSVIEEPENYVHPWVCRLLIDHIREFFEGRSCIITTHSETILNSVKPSEIIVCENLSGVTHIKRLSDELGIETAISNSGFGCGYHYVTGAFGGTPIC